MRKYFILALAIAPALFLSSCRSSSSTLSESTMVANPAVQGGGIAYTQPTASQTATVVTPAASTPASNNNTVVVTPPVVKPGDRTESVVVVDPSDANKLQSYNVVVGAFGVKANADNFKNVLVSRGYNAFVVQNQQGLYRVVAGGYAVREQAEAARATLRSSYPNDDPNTTPKAWILIPVR